MRAAEFIPILDPFFLAHRGLRRQIRTMAAMASGVVLDVGCGTMPYRAFFSSASYFGAEVPVRSEFGSAKRPDFVFDGNTLPVADASVDAILCSQVLEHVFDADAFLRELHRVLRPGGHLLLTVPFVWDEHEQPYDFARYSSFGLRHLAETNGYDVVYQAKTLGDASLFSQLWLAYLYKALRRLPRFAAKAILVPIALVANPLGLFLGILMPKSADLYLDNAMVWVKRCPQIRVDNP